MLALACVLGAFATVSAAGEITGVNVTAEGYFDDMDPSYEVLASAGNPAGTGYDWNMSGRGGKVSIGVSDDGEDSSNRYLIINNAPTVGEAPPYFGTGYGGKNTAGLANKTQRPTISETGELSLNGTDIADWPYLVMDFDVMSPTANWNATLGLQARVFLAGDTSLDTETKCGLSINLKSPLALRTDENGTYLASGDLTVKKYVDPDRFTHVTIIYESVAEDAVRTCNLYVYVDGELFLNYEGEDISGGNNADAYYASTPHMSYDELRFNWPLTDDETLSVGLDNVVTRLFDTTYNGNLATVLAAKNNLNDWESSLYTDNQGPVLPEPPKFYGAALVLDNAIKLRYMVRPDNVADFNDLVLFVWSTPQTEYTPENAEFTLDYNGIVMTYSGIKYPSFDFDGVGAKKLADSFYAVVGMKTESGEIVCSAPVKYGALQYCYNKLGKTGTASTDAKLTELINEMLDYGAASQKYLNYKTDRLANDDFYQIKTSGGTLPDGFTSGLYKEGEAVKLSASEANNEGRLFSYWKNSSGTTVSTEREFSVTVSAKNEQYTAVYEGCAHTGEWTTVTAPTCTTVGKAQQICTVCSAVSYKELPVDANAHKWSTWSIEKAATCSAAGTEKRVCQNGCGASETKSIPIDSDAHSFGSWQTEKEATCYEEGVEKRVCLNGCGSFETNPIPKLSHNVSDQYSFDANGHWHGCINEGCDYSEDYETHVFNSTACIICGASKWGSSDSEETPILPVS